MSLNIEPPEVELPSSLTRCRWKPLLGKAARHAPGNCTHAEYSGVKLCACAGASLKKFFVSNGTACLMATAVWIPDE